MVHPFFKVSPLKRLLSYLIPVTVANSTGSENKFLEFILYRNQWQLATEDALYSDGNRYQPYRIAFKNVPKQRLELISDCLILGTGLGSIVQILHGKYKIDAHFSLVEYDEKILHWALESLASQGITKIDPYCNNAADFVQQHHKKYDLICIDIFSGREVPTLFTEIDFLQRSKKLLKPNGIWIMNYIINDEKETLDFLRNVKALFPDVEVIEKEQNRILIAL
jgi:2-polyprenyl-3-methyl-5-hydroxy-6-metoxy-1,4-benzoquinol methylase